MKLLPLLAIPLGLMFVIYGLRRKSIFLEREPSAGLERTVTVGVGVLLLALGVGFGLLVFRLLFR